MGALQGLDDNFAQAGNGDEGKRGAGVQQEQRYRGEPPAPDEPASAAAGAIARPGSVLAPFSIKAFRFQWPGDLAVAIATEMEMVILGWYVLSETGSVLLLTLFGALHFFGTLTAPLIGVVGDRIGLRPLLILMRTTYVLLTAVQTSLALSGLMTPAAVFAVASLMAMVRPSDISVRTALVAELMPPALLTGAVGLSRSTGDSARIGGALAGATLFALLGIGLAYVAVTTLYVVGLLLTAAASLAGPLRSIPASRHPSPWGELAAGLAYVWRTPHLLGGMALAVLANLTAFPLTGGLMPYIARDVFGLDKAGLGLLIASWATGALLGSLTVGAIGSRLALARTMLFATAVWHLLLLAFVHSPTAMLGALFLVLAGFAQSISMVSLAAMLLRTSGPEFRGRIMGVRMLSTYSLPIGLILLGVLIEHLGFALTATLWVAEGLVLTLAIGLHWRRALWSPDAVANAR